MKITTRLTLIFTLTLATLVVLLPVLFVTFHEFKDAKDRLTLATDIKVNFFERASLRDMYFLFREERVHQQWDKNLQISDTLIAQAKKEFVHDQDQLAIEQLRLAIQDTYILFHRIVENTNTMKHAGANLPIYEELDKRLCSQLLLKASKVRDLTSDLEDLSDTYVEKAYQKLNIAIGIFAFVLSLAILFTSYSIIRLIRKRLIPLLEGARLIANGNLEHRIVIDDIDEFSKVGESINHMTDNLQIFTRNLQNEVAAHLAAKEKIQLAASVFSHVREGIIITAADGSIIDVNAAFSTITGYSRDDVLGQNPRILKSERHPKEFYQHLWRELKTKKFWRGEIWNKRKNNDLYAEMLTISAVESSEGLVQHYVGLMSDITEIKEHELHLEQIAHHDALTQLPNRILFADRLNQAMAHVLRNKQTMAVAYIDLDGFKAVNDTYGHDYGDEVLKTVSTRMKDALRDGDTLARLGGDEFAALVLDLADMDVTAKLLMRLLAAASQPVFVNSQTLQVSASIGVTFFPQDNGVDSEGLLQQADQAMYHAKQSGKGRYVFFDAHMDG